MGFKVSIIIPTYNVEAYIEECLNSLLNQTLKEIEVICIDDGSTDGTINIVRSYKEKWNNITLTEQRNSGSGVARNKGIMIASGEYIAFMDADDFYPNKNVLFKLYETAKKIDANICGGSACIYRNGVLAYDGLRRGYVFYENGWIDKEDFPTFGGYWRFIYKRSFLIDHDIFFPNYLRNQDPPFFLKAISDAEKVYCIKDYVYCYRKEHKQVIYDKEKAIDYIKGIRDTLYIAKKNKLFKIYKSLLKELHGEPSALIYFYSAKSVSEMVDIAHEINLIICEKSDEKPSDVQLLLEGDKINEYVSETKVELNELLLKLTCFPYILIFGAGTVGRKVLGFLKQNGCTPEAFVVSDTAQNSDSIEEIEVKGINEYIEKKNECFIIIATFSYLHCEIENILYKKGFRNIYPIDMEKFYLWCGEIIH